MKLTSAELKHFWEGVDSSGGAKACWPWLRSKNPDGYGHFYFRRMRAGANRIALIIKLGRYIKPGKQAIHTCDNPPCCNPDHLLEATPLENMLDKVRKGRAKGGGPGYCGDKHWSRLRPERISRVSKNRGETNGGAKLTKRQVLYIRRAFAKDQKSQTALSVKFGVAPETIRSITHRLKWKHI